VYRNREWGLTDDRLIEIRGILGRDAHVVDLADINDLQASHGWWNKIMGAGELELKIAGRGGVSAEEGKSRFRLVALSDHQEVFQRIEDLRNQARPGKAA
jgi:uncharacterized membrane protein YdbT with pleckstrin-like domain